MIIRAANQKDCKVVYDLCKTPELLDPSGEPPKLWWIQSFIKENQIFFVAEINKKVIGFILGERITGNCCIFWMSAVKKQFQGRGIGERLLLKAEEECKKRKLKVITIYGFSKSKKVLNLLQKHNYEKGQLYYEFIKYIK
ncbi:MAG: GNAT family N-acetyltransferase [archaeon]